VVAGGSCISSKHRHGKTCPNSWVHILQLRLSQVQTSTALTDQPAPRCDIAQDSPSHQA